LGFTFGHFLFDIYANQMFQQSKVRDMFVRQVNIIKQSISNLP